jgi:hypothetical protein
MGVSDVKEKPSKSLPPQFALAELVGVHCHHRSGVFHF